jgi:hypothetical protein
MDYKVIFDEYKWYIVAGGVVFLLAIVLILKKKSASSAPSPKPEKSGHSQSGHGHSHGEEEEETYITRLADASPEGMAQMIEIIPDYDGLCDFLKNMNNNEKKMKLFSNIYFDMYVERDMTELKKLVESAKKSLGEDFIKKATNWKDAERLIKSSKKEKNEPKTVTPIADLQSDEPENQAEEEQE